MSKASSETQSVNLEETAYPRQIAGKLYMVATIKNLYSNFY